MFIDFPTRSDSPSRGEIILWWERRRILYNVVVGVVGFISVAVLLIIGRRVVSDQEPLFSPFLLFVGILLYAIAANICYTLGWLAELVLHKFGDTNTDKFATSAFRIGLGLSCVVSSLPIWFVLTLWVSHS